MKDVGVIVLVSLFTIVISAFLFVRPPFRVGDRVEFKQSNQCGTVMSMDAMSYLGLSSSRFVSVKFDGTPSGEEYTYNVLFLEYCPAKERAE